MGSNGFVERKDDPSQLSGDLSILLPGWNWSCTCRDVGRWTRWGPWNDGHDAASSIFVADDVVLIGRFGWPLIQQKPHLLNILHDGVCVEGG